MKYIQTAAVAAIFLAGSATAGLAETWDWKLQSFWSAQSEPQQAIERFAENVKAATNGQMNITVLPNKAIVPHNQSLQAVGSKILEMHKSTPCYSAGIDTAFGMLCDMNAGYENPYQFVTWYYKGGGIELARKLYAQHGLYFVGPVPWGTESIPTKNPIRSVEEFKGVKIRMPEGPSSDLFRSIGAAPVSVHGSEVYTSLEKGVISATDWSTISINEKVGLHKVAPYAIYPGIHSIPVGDVSVNLELWESLPPDVQQVIDLGVRALAVDMVQTFDTADAVIVNDPQSKGITLVEWSDEEREKLRSAAKEVWETNAAKSDLAGEIYASQVKWLKALGLL